jgi:hypothetical protein
MGDRFIIPEEINPEKPKKTQISSDIPGKITETIGSGKHAQAAIVWQTIKWSFIAGGGFSVIFFVFAWLTDKKEAPTDDIKMIWSIFIPVIMLALGYIFGKGKE